jgi:hypothetical protein
MRNAIFFLFLIAPVFATAQPAATHGKGEIRFTIPRAIRATRQVSGHDFSVLLEPSEAMRKQRSRAVQALKNILPCAAGRRAAQRSDLKSFRMPKLSIFMQRMHHV